MLQSSCNQVPTDVLHIENSQRLWFGVALKLMTGCLADTHSVHFVMRMNTTQDAWKTFNRVWHHLEHIATWLPADADTTVTAIKADVYLTDGALITSLHDLFWRSIKPIGSFSQ